jgi:hypothetical protein
MTYQQFFYHLATKWSAEAREKYKLVAKTREEKKRLAKQGTQ